MLRYTENMEHNDILKIAITRIPKVGPKALRQLISYCGGLEAVFKTKKKALLKIPMIGPAVANQISKHTSLIEAEKTLETLIKMNVDFHFYLDEEYPDRLKHYPDAPPIIFFKGNTSLNPSRTISIVGTRRPSTQGEVICRKIVEALSQIDVTIFSGLAYGIDTVAHQASVDFQIPTIGILASGFPTIYPSSNKKLALKMMEQGGLLTEFHPYHKLMPGQFPQRNRIIAMLSDAIIVIESKTKGGSMITASFGNQYHKDVFAVPGRPTDKMSLGCNYLIKNNQAALIENGNDVLEMMQWTAGQGSKQKQGSLFLDLTPDEEKVLGILDEKGKINKDQLHYISEIQISSLSSILLNLEFKGAIKTLPGNKYAVLS